MDKVRETELLDLVEEHLNDNQWFDYHDWDGLIECDEALTTEELGWLRKNVEVVVSVKRRK